MGEVPLPRLALMGNASMDLCQGELCLTSMARTTDFPCQRPIGLADLSEGSAPVKLGALRRRRHGERAQRLRRSEPGAITAYEKCVQPKVKTCAFTRHDSDSGCTTVMWGVTNNSTNS